MICIIACTDNKVLLVEWANSASCYTYFACASYSCSSFQTSIHLIKMQMEILQIARILDQLCEWERKYMDSGQSRRTWWWHVVLLLPHTQSYTQTQAHTHTHNCRRRMRKFWLTVIVLPLLLAHCLLLLFGSGYRVYDAWTATHPHKRGDKIHKGKRRRGKSSSIEP